MQISVAVPCVGYADFLNLTLPHTAREFGSVTVITTSTDVDTLQCARAHSVPVHVTNAWYDGGASLDKAAALNAWLDSLPSNPELWMLTLDADILVPTEVLHDLHTLDTRYLYGVPRRLCKQLNEWNAFAAGQREWESFPVDSPPVFNGKLWGRHPTGNVAATCGYFQLWHASNSVGDKRFTHCPTAAYYDIAFALSFGEEHRVNLADREVLHLGPTGSNWAGRQSEEWIGAHRFIRDDLENEQAI